MGETKGLRIPWSVAIAVPRDDSATTPSVHRPRTGGLSRSFRRKACPLGGISSPDATEPHDAKRISLDPPYFTYPLYSSARRRGVVRASTLATRARERAT